MTFYKSLDCRNNIIHLAKKKLFYFSDPENITFKLFTETDETYDFKMKTRIYYIYKRIRVPGRCYQPA